MRDTRPSLADSHLFPAFNHDQSREAEQEYDRLRDLARQEAAKRGECFSRVCAPSYPVQLCFAVFLVISAPFRPVELKS